MNGNMNGNSLGIVDKVADSITRLQFLEQQAKDDAEMIALLKRQKDDLANELSSVKHNHGVEMFALQQERDAAIKAADEVKKTIDQIGTLALSGVRRMAGDNYQASAQQVSQASTDSRLPKPVVAN